MGLDASANCKKHGVCHKIIMLKAMEQTEKAMDEGKLMGLAPAWKDG